MVLAFDRTLAEARPFERAAFAVIARRVVEVVGRDWPDTIRDIHLSAQFLGGGRDPDRLSVFFRLASVGGSGATFYFFLARHDGATEARVYGLSAITSEAGAVELVERADPDALPDIRIFESGGPDPQGTTYVFDRDLDTYIEAAG